MHTNRLAEHALRLVSEASPLLPGSPAWHALLHDLNALALLTRWRPVTPDEFDDVVRHGPAGLRRFLRALDPDRAN